MARTRRKRLAVGVDECRVRLQTGEPILFLDARKERGELRVAGSLRVDPELVRPPCPKHNYVVVYCA